MKRPFTVLIRCFVVCVLLIVVTFRGSAQTTPQNPTGDIVWDAGGQSGVLAIQNAFNNARAVENSQLGTSFPTNLTLPSQSAWDSLDNSEKALVLVNGERMARGLLPLQRVDSNLVVVAQPYARYMDSTGVYSHNADGRTFTQRLDANPHVFGHYEWATELIAKVSGTISAFVPTAVYMFIYSDAGLAWGHRMEVLRGPFLNNSGTSDAEGTLGVGLSSSFGSTILVCLVIDPKADYMLSVGTEVASVPRGPSLEQNYPNPFNPSTVIRYGLPSKSHVSLTLFNTLGQQVAVLQNGEQDAGYHEVKFDAAGMASGEYFYRIQAGVYVETRKLLLIK
jgi:uncharacterized protein YkwD